MGKAGGGLGRGLFPFRVVLFRGAGFCPPPLHPRAAGLGGTSSEIVVGLPFQVGTELSPRQRRPITSPAGTAPKVIGCDHRGCAGLLKVLADVLRNAERIVQSLI